MTLFTLKVTIIISPDDWLMLSFVHNIATATAPKDRQHHDQTQDSGDTYWRRQDPRAGERDPRASSWTY